AVYDAGEHEGRAYRVREVLVEATDLEARLREGKLDPDLAVKVAKQIAEGLAYIHAKGVVHGRLTPRAVLIDDRNVAKLEVASASIPDAATRASRRSRPRPRKRAASRPRPGATSTRSDASSTGCSPAWRPSTATSRRSCAVTRARPRRP